MTTETRNLVAAAKAMLARPWDEAFSCSDTFMDLENSVRIVEAGQGGNALRDLQEATDAFVSELDDRSRSDTPEWEALSLALDASREAAPDGTPPVPAA